MKTSTNAEFAFFIELPNDMVHLVIEKMDLLTVSNARNTSRMMRATCEMHHEQRTRDWIQSERNNHKLKDMLKKACRTEDAKIAKLVVSTMQTRLLIKDLNHLPNPPPNTYYFFQNINRLLDEAVSDGHVKIVEVLLSVGADPKQKKNMISSMLHTASARGHDDIMALLIGAGAEKDALDIYGQSPSAVYKAFVVPHKRPLIEIHRMSDEESSRELMRRVEESGFHQRQLTCPRDTL
jgi:ankyrin repeat protein